MDSTSSPKSYFTVDRIKGLRSGQTISCKPPRGHGVHTYNIEGFCDGTEMVDLAHCRFPQGISAHGAHYLFNWKLDRLTGPQGLGVVYTEPVMELIFELVRRATFPNCPSRLESVFAWDNLEAALSFRQMAGRPEAPIYRVEAGQAFRADMSLLHLAGNAMGAWLFAERYWSGWGAAVPTWEVLLTPPVLVAEQVG